MVSTNGYSLSCYWRFANVSRWIDGGPKSLPYYGTQWHSTSTSSLTRAYHDSPIGVHRGREATYEALSHDFYWPNVAKHVRNWIRRCPSCIKLKSTDPKRRLMQIRIFDGPIDTLVIPSHYPIFARAVSAGNTLRHLGFKLGFSAWSVVLHSKNTVIFWETHPPPLVAVEQAALLVLTNSEGISFSISSSPAA